MACFNCISIFPSLIFRYEIRFKHTFFIIFPLCFRATNCNIRKKWNRMEEKNTEIIVFDECIKCGMQIARTEL